MDITFVTPTKLQCGDDLQIAISAMRSLYATIRTRPMHLFSTRDMPHLTAKFHVVLNELGVRYKVVSKDLNYLQAFLSLTKAVDTKYYYFQSADVTTITNKDVIGMSIEAMEKDPKLCHVRIGGYPVASGGTNYESFIVKDGVIMMNDRSNCSLEPIMVNTSDVVWTLPMTAKCQESVFGWPIWCSVLRTDVLKRSISCSEHLLTPAETSMSDIIRRICGYRDLVGYDLHRVGWPAHMKWIEDYKQGFLNLANYTCPLGRVTSEKDMLDNHQHEVRSVADLVELRRQRVNS